MASDPTKNAKGLGPELQQTAREAARRSGLSVAEWLESVIVDSAADEAMARVRRRSARRGQAESLPAEKAPRTIPARTRPAASKSQRVSGPDPEDDRIRAMDARLETLGQQ